MAEQEVLVTLDNLEYYQEELIKKLPKDQVWYGNMEPSYGLPDEYILAVNYQAGKVYYRLANKKWKLISSGSAEEGGTINSRVNVSRVSQKDLYISPDDGKCNISFKWTCSISGKQVNTPGNITIVVNGSEREKFKIEPGTVTKDIRQYLKDGSNTVVFNIVDGYGTPNSIDFKVEVVKLLVSVPGYTQNSLISLKGLDGGPFKINVTVAGGTNKTLHIIIHAKEEEKEQGKKDVERIVEYEGSGSITQTISILQEDILSLIGNENEDAKYHGSRLIEFYATHTFNTTGKTIYSNSVFFDTLWIDDINSNPNAIIASAFNTTEGKQYELFKIPYFLYKMGRTTCDVQFTTISRTKNEQTGEITENKTTTTPQTRETGIPLEWMISSNFPGEHIFIIEAGTLSEDGTSFTIEDRKEFIINLSQQSESPITRPQKIRWVEFVAEQTDSNNLERRTEWPYFYGKDKAEENELKPIFTNFDWINNGWELRDERPALKIANGAQLEIPYKIFGFQDDPLLYFPEQGGTIEIDVSFDDVSNSELDFFTCFDESTKRGIKISPSRALLSNGEKTVEVKYANSESKKYNNSMKFSFVINKKIQRKNPDGTDKVDDKLGSMYIFINGVGASASDYVNDNFSHNNTCMFSSEGCSVHLHSFKVYAEDFTSKDVLQNWICDMNVGDQINAYNENWFYDNNGGISYSEVLSRIPCLTIYGKMPTYKSDKRYVSMKFEGAGKYDFTIPEVEIDVQGTSSQYYPVKNWKFKSKYKKKIEDENGDKVEVKITSNFAMTETGEEVDSYALGDDQLPAQVFCLKADYMETSSTHNTVTANLVHTMYNEKTPAQKILLKEGEKEASQEEKDRASKTRTTIYGRPIAVFYVENPDDPNAIPVFGGKYNFNYDKGAEHIFGFFEDDRFEVIDCVEFRSNDNKMCQLEISDYEGFIETTSKAKLKEYDENSWIKIVDEEGNETVKGAYNWGNAFEFRYLYHREDVPSYSYLKAATDWVVNRDSERATNLPLEREYKTSDGVAKFLYDDDSQIVKFYQDVEKDGKITTRTRRALNPEYSDKDDFDYAVEEVTGYTYNETNEKVPCTYLCLFWDENENKEMYIFDRDTKNYRLTIFKNEFAEHFNVHYCLMYFLLMELLGMIDSGAKNMFWATWGERHKKHSQLNLDDGTQDYNVIWYPIFYDMDSILGLNNVGLMNIPYNMDFESTFSGTGSNGGFIYNSGKSRFWNNFRLCYQTELNELFNEKVGDNTFNVNKILKMYEDHSENFPASMYNEDAQLKIIDKYFQGYYEATPEELEEMIERGETPEPKYPDWMHVYQGDRYYYRRFWFPNRFNYMLSKNFAGSYAKSFISMRLWDPRNDEKNQGKEIDVDYDFDITTWKDQFTTIKYGSTAVSEKCEAGKTTKIKAPNDSYNDSETAIFGASNIKSIGNVSNKYATTIDLSSATQIQEIDLGSSDPEYSNEGFNTVNFGSSSMLRRVNVENCKGLTSDLRLSNCKNIIEINAKGSNITGVEVNSNGGPLETLLLPDTVKSLRLKNYPKMKKHGFEYNTIIDEDGQEQTVEKEIGFLLPQKKTDDGVDDGYNITTLVVENTPNVNTREIVQDRVEDLGILSLTNIDWTEKINGPDNSLPDGEVLLRIIQRGESTGDDKLRGDGTGTKPTIHGYCDIKNLKDYLEEKINLYFNGGPVNNIPYGQRKFNLQVTSQRVATREAKFFDFQGNQIDSGITDDRVEVLKPIVFKKEYPQRAPEWDFEYKFVGWKERISGKEYKTLVDGRYPLGDMPAFTGEPGTDQGLLFDPIYEKQYIDFYFYFRFEDGTRKPETLTTQDLVLAPIQKDFDTKINTTDKYTSYTNRFKRWIFQGEDKDEYNIEAGGYITIPKIEKDGKIQREFVYQAYSEQDRMYRVRFYDRDKNLLHAEGHTKKDEYGDIYYLDNQIKIPAIDFTYYDWEKDYTLEQWINKTNGIHLRRNKDNSEVPFQTIFANSNDIVPDVSPNDGNIFGNTYYELDFEPDYSSELINYTINFHCIEGGPKNTSLTYPDKNIKTINCNWNQAVISPSMDPKDWDSEHEEFGYDLIGWRLRPQREDELTKEPADLIELSNWHTHCENEQLNKPDARVLDYYVAYEPHYFNIIFEYYATADKALTGIPKAKTENRHYLYKLSNPLTESEKKYSTQDKHYTFSSWNPSLQPVVGEATYQAQYSSEPRTYSVKFVHQDNENQILYGPVQIEYGKSPTYKGTTPSKKDDGGGANAKYQYIFDGWKKKGTSAVSKDLNTFIIKEDTILIATFKRETKEYDITWVNKPSGLLDGESAVSINQTKADKVKYGVKPTYNYNEPKITVPNNSQWYYQFIGWQKGSDGVIFKNPNDPNNPSTGTEGGIQLVDGPAKYGAVFQQNWASYDIKFVDWNEKVLKDWTSYKWGTQLTANEIPQGPYIEGYRPGYAFIGWKRESDEKEFPIKDGITPTVHRKETYKAYYEAIPYIYTFQNYKGEPLNDWTISGWTNDNEPPTVKNPTYASTEDTAFAFMGWIDMSKGEIEEGEVFDENNERFYPMGTSLPRIYEDTTFRAYYLEGNREYIINFYYINTGLPTQGDPTRPTRYDKCISRTMYWGDIIYKPTEEEYQKANIECEGYTFHGFDTLETKKSTIDDGLDFDGGRVRVVDSDPTKQYNFYVIWSINQYVIEFKYIKNDTDTLLWKEYSNNTTEYEQKVWTTFDGIFYDFGSDVEYLPENNAFFETIRKSRDCHLTFSHWERRRTQDGYVLGDGIDIVREHITYVAIYTSEPRPYKVYWYAGNAKLGELDSYYGQPTSEIASSRPAEYCRGYWSDYTTVNNVKCAINQITEETSIASITGTTIYYATMYDVAKYSTTNDKGEEIDTIDWSTSGVTLNTNSNGNEVGIGGTGSITFQSANSFKCFTQSNALNNNEQIYRLLDLRKFDYAKNGIQMITAYFEHYGDNKPAIDLGVHQTRFGVTNTSGSPGSSYGYESKGLAWNNWSSESLTLSADSTAYGPGSYSTTGTAVLDEKRFYLGVYANRTGDGMNTYYQKVFFRVWYHNKQKGNYGVYVNGIKVS